MGHAALPPFGDLLLATIPASAVLLPITVPVMKLNARNLPSLLLCKISFWAALRVLLILWFQLYIYTLLGGPFGYPVAGYLTAGFLVGQGWIITRDLKSYGVEVPPPGVGVRVAAALCAAAFALWLLGSALPH